MKDFFVAKHDLIILFSLIKKIDEKGGSNPGSDDADG